ncbi:sugar transferase [Polynucleobacter paneuropaeus]|nr:sugar transferase [Polynucleobacter paneuropaeus]
MKRLMDLLLVFVFICIAWFPILAVSILIPLTSKGPILYWSRRVGKDGVIFLMPKFRSMHVEAPVVATDLLDQPAKWLTPIGSFLRKSSLDETPQLWSILKGDMSFVGPRPALFNQAELIRMRDLMGINTLLPGLTGWAQVNGRDDISLENKLQFDAQYLQRQCFWLDLYIIWLTFMKVVRRDGVSH